MGLTQLQALAFAIIDMLESRAMEMGDELNALDSTIGTAIEQYEGLSL